MSAEPPLLPTLPTKADLVYDYVKGEILEGRWAPTERISIDALARKLGVSKIPIREAIQRLESHGLVVLNMHVGPTVAPVSQQQLRGAYLSRQALEPLAARLAAERITDEQIAELDRCQSEMRACLASRELEKLASVNSEFHVAIARATGYQVLVEVTSLLILCVRRYRAVAPLDLDNWRHVIMEHDGIVEKLRQHDQDGAAHAAEQHAISQAHNDLSYPPAPPEDRG